MNNYIAFKVALGLFLLNALNWSSAAQENCAEQVANIRPAVVAITAYNSQGQVLEQGNGFFVSREGRLLTCRHLLRGAAQVEVRTSDGKVYPVRMVVAEDRNLDLIQLVVDTTEDGVPYLKITDVNAKSGDQFTVICHQRCVNGAVLNIRELDETGRNFQFSARSPAGVTGAPVVNEKGEVMAVATEQTVEDQTLLLAIASSRVLGMVSQRAVTIADWNKATKGDPAVGSEGLFFAAANMIFNRDYSRALPLLEEAARQNSGDAETRLYCGYAKAQLWRYQEALQDYREAVRIAPRYTHALNNLGAMYQGMRRFEDAVAFHRQAIDLKPDFAVAYGNLAVALDRLGRYEEAVAAYNKAIQHGSGPASTHNRLGVAYHKLGRQREAVESFSKAVQLKPDFAEALNNLGVASSYLGRDKEAMEALAQAIRVKPDFAEACNNLGLLYSKTSRYAEGIQYYKEAVRVSPTFAEAQYNLGVSYLVLGDDHSAFKTYGTLKNLNGKLASQLFNLLEKQYTVGLATGTTRSVNGFVSPQISVSQAPIQDLIVRINSLVAKGALHRSIADGLIAELEIASHQPDTSNVIMEINLLGRFVERLSDLVRAQEISDEEGQSLIDAANSIINRLSG
jgi:Flp pilus assembly protein TadD